MVAIKQVKDTFMYKEIFQQPEIISKTIEKSDDMFHEFYSMLTEERYRLHIFGSGSSYHAGIGGGIAFANTLGRLITVDHASEWPYRFPSSYTKSGLVIAISQSGESGDVLKSARIAKKRGMKLVAITNSIESSLGSLGDLSFITPAGKENAIAATKSYSSALATMLYWAAKLESRNNKQAELLIKEILGINTLMKDILSSVELKIRDLVPYISGEDVVYFLGMGSNFSTALEGAMKLKETGDVFAEGFGFREFMHGHIQKVSERTPTIIVLSGEEDSEKINTGIKSLAKYQTPMIVFTQNETIIDKTNINCLREFILLKKCVMPLISPLTLIIPLQLLACYNSISRNLNPDKPLKLTKITR